MEENERKDGELREEKEREKGKKKGEGAMSRR